MSTPPNLIVGRVQIAPSVSLPIVDCKAWRVQGGAAACARGLPLDCAACASRESRGGNLIDPPIMDAGEIARLAAAMPAVAQVAPAQEDRERWRGLGDVIAAATRAVGVKPCGACQRRREALNRLVPFEGAGSPQEPSASPGTPDTPETDETPQTRS
jgi:hypothetical protein